MEQTKNVVGWFEIPVKNMERAVKFYQTVFNFELSRQQLGPLDMAWFPWVETGVGSAGSLVKYEDSYQPSTKGVLIYFTSFGGDLNQELSRVEQAGGKIEQAKTLIADDIGYMAVFIDTEGNRVALHSRG